jgi:hypothetical protein
MAHPRTELYRKQMNKYFPEKTQEELNLACDMYEKYLLPLDIMIENDYRFMRQILFDWTKGKDDKPE